MLSVNFAALGPRAHPILIAPEVTAAVMSARVPHCVQTKIRISVYRILNKKFVGITAKAIKTIIWKMVGDLHHFLWCDFSRYRISLFQIVGAVVRK